MSDELTEAELAGGTAGVLDVEEEAIDPVSGRAAVSVEASPVAVSAEVEASARGVSVVDVVVEDPSPASGGFGVPART